MAKVVSDLRKITPAMAKKMLDQNVCNRQVRTRWVDQLCKIILDGCWHVTHQGVAFDTQNRLIDGQHRLMAIVKANKAVDMAVAYNLDPEAIYAIDQGKTRSVLDVAGPLGNHDMQITKRHVGTARTMLATFYSVKTPMTNEDTIRYIAKHREAIDFAIEHLTANTHQSTILSGVIARAFYTVDRARLKRFCATLCENVTLDSDDQAALVLNRWFLANIRSANGWIARRDMYAKIEAGLSAFIAKKKLQKLYGVTSELFPIPGDSE